MKSLSTTGKNRLILVGCAALLFCDVLQPTSIIAQETRIVAGLSSADRVVQELEHLVSKLAGREESYKDNIFPNVDIFLIGVDTQKPVRFDPIFSEQYGMELQVIIPISNLDEFLQDNLDPIGIIPKRDRTDRDLYALTGKVFEGWLRVLKDPDYVVIFPRKEAIPKGMPHPFKLHETLTEKDYSLFAGLENSQNSAEVRQAAFEKMSKNTVDGIQKRPDETQNAHALRKAVLNQQLNVLQQWFVESQGFELGSRLDQEKNISLLNLLFTPTPDTQLQKDVTRIQQEPSYFAPIKGVDKAVLNARIHLTFDDRTAQGLRDLYKLSDTVAQEQIAADEKISAEEKSSRVKLSQLLNKILTKSSERKVVDGFIDIVPSGDAHAFLMGILCDGQDDVQAAIDEVANGRKEMTLTKNVVEVEGVQIHKLELGEKAPAALKDLYGPGYDTVYLAASEKAFWLAFGNDAQKELSDRIQTVLTAKDVESNHSIISVNAQLGALAKSLNGLINDESSFIGSLLHDQQLKRAERKEANQKENTDEKEESERPAREAASNFLSFDWIEKVLGTMEGEDDSVVFELKVDEEGRIVGSGEARKGILKAIGVMIANFADETLQ